MRASSTVLAGLLALAAFGSAKAQPNYPPSSYSGAQTPPASGYDANRDTRTGGAYDDRGDEAPPPDLMRELSLRPGQSAALADYKASFQPDPQREARDRADEARLPSMTTPERLDYAARQMDADRQDFERTAAATRRFYAQLSADQKRSFDRLTAPQPDQGDDEDQPPPRQAPR